MTFYPMVDHSKTLTDAEYQELLARPCLHNNSTCPHYPWPRESRHPTPPTEKLAREARLSNQLHDNWPTLERDAPPPMLNEKGDEIIPQPPEMVAVLEAHRKRLAEEAASQSTSQAAKNISNNTNSNTHTSAGGIESSGLHHDDNDKASGSLSHDKQRDDTNTVQKGSTST